MTTNELIDLHMGLIKKIASKFYNTEREDLIQVVYLKLIKILKRKIILVLVLMLIIIFMEKCII